MSVLRVMTYRLKGSPASEAAGTAELISRQRPELVFLQQLPESLLESLAKETGLTAYAMQGKSGFLSRHPLCALQSISLGGEGHCLRADLNLAGKRLHLFNVQLVSDPGQRGQQIARLFMEDLLGATLPCATLVAGDFSLPLWGGGQWLLQRRLKRAVHPGWGANYPAAFPLWPRDRFYLRGPIRSLAGQVVKNQGLCKLSDHLPVISTLELTDTRIYLKVPVVGKQLASPVTG